MSRQARTTAMTPKECWILESYRTMTKGQRDAIDGAVFCFSPSTPPAIRAGI